MQTILRASFIEMRINFRNLLTLKLILALSLTAIAEGQPRAKSQPQSFDIIIKGGTVYDGTGRPPVRTDVGIKGDRIAAIGNLSRATAPALADATGLARAPGLTNMVSLSQSSLIM